MFFRGENVERPETRNGRGEKVSVNIEFLPRDRRPGDILPLIRGKATGANRL